MHPEATMKLPNFITAMNQRSKKIALWAIGFVTLSLLFCILALPLIIKNQAEKQIFAITGRVASISGVSFNPFGMTLTVKGFRFLEPDKSTVFVAFDRMRVSLSSMSLFRFAPVIDELMLENPKLTFVRTAPNRYNFSDILDKLSQKPKTEKTAASRFSINNISITGGAIDFNDKAAPVPVSHTVRELVLAIPFISNIPYLAEKYTDPQFSALVDGGRLSFSGKAKPLAKAVEASINLKLDKLNLAHYQPYIPANLPVKLANGALTLDLDLVYRIHKDKKPELFIKGLTRLDSFDLKERSGVPVALFKSFEAQAREIELFGKLAVFEKVSLDGLTLHVSRNTQGQTNLQRLMPVSTPASTKKVTSEKSATKEPAPFKLSIGTISLSDNTVIFQDLLPKGGFKTQLSGITATVTNFSTIADTKNDYRMSLNGDRGEKLTVSGSSTLSPLITSSSFSLTGLDLQRGWPYLQQFLTAPVKGMLELKGTAEYTASEGASLKDTSVILTNISTHYGNKDGVNLSRLETTNISFSQKENRAEVGGISLGKGKITISREADGKFSPLLLLKQPAVSETVMQSPVATKKQEKTNQKPLNYLVKQIAINGVTVGFKDKMVEGDPSFSIDDIRFTAGNLTGPKFSAMPLNFNAKYAGKAPVRMNGTVVPQPFSYKGSVAFSKLPIRDFEDYIPDTINLFFVAGTLDSDLKLNISQAASGKPTGSFTGTAGVRGFHVVDTVMEEDLLKWESLQLDGIAGQLEPFSLAIRQIALNGVYSRIAVRKDRTLNLQNLVKKQVEEKPKAEASPQTQEKPQVQAQTQKAQIKIDALTIQDGTMAFSDAHLPQQFKTIFHNLGGRVSGLSSEMNTRADVDLRGSLENQSPLQITGTVNPLREDLFVDLTISFKDIELSPATPYSGTYLGYKIDRGKLFLDLKYHIENKNLVAENKIFVDQFTFGDSVESDKATKLPVRLGVALLKDRNGQINLDLPVTGRTDDPKFSIWGVVWKVVANLFIKAATSPFSLLASMMGSSEDLSAVTFTSGSSNLSQSEEKKLTTLAKALADRPGLKVEIIGFVDKTHDPEGYRAELLQKKMRQEKYLELAKSRQIAEGQQAEQIQIKPEETSRLLKAVYLKEKFPKPRNIIGMLKELPDAEMKKLIFANTTVGEQELQQLAAQRAVAVQQYLITKGGMDSKRLFQKRDDIYKTPKQEKGMASRVELNPIAQ